MQAFHLLKSPDIAASILFFSPQNKILKKIYDAVTSETFEIFILGIIMLNMSVMMWQHYGQSKAISDALHIL